VWQAPGKKPPPQPWIINNKENMRVMVSHPRGLKTGIYEAINYFLLIKSKLNASRGTFSLLKTIKRTARLRK
jgi:hypothetical protein